MSTMIKIFLCIFFYNAYAAPVRKTSEKPPENNQFNDLHYKNYLEEIIAELENDKDFAEKIKYASEHNRTEHIAQSLKFVNHNVRSKLDEIKRREVDRLNVLENELNRRKLESKGIKVPPPNFEFSKIVSSDKSHLDHTNVHTFEISDLENLIKKTEKDLKIVDSEQEAQYKTHEMKKEHLKKKKLESIKDEEERKKIEEQLKESDKRHQNHSKVHHPGNEEQLKEVWDKTDHLDPKEFNPKAFFDLHDINADGHLDINEIESLMQNELSKVYEANNSDDDMQEKYHEMMRMRLEIMKMMDKNHDNMVSKDEFIEYTTSTKFKDDTEWKTEEEENTKPYSEKEFKDFEEEYARNEDEEEDEFSDQDDSLRHIPKNANAQPPNMPDTKTNTKVDPLPPPANVDAKSTNQNGAPPTL